MAAPKVFISYSHDSDGHKAWVLKLAVDLRGFGIDVVLDHWDLVPGQDISLFMQKGIAGADRVLLICSANYVSKAELGAGGVGYERLIVTSEVVQSIDTIKFVPVIRDNDSPRVVPNFLGPRRYVDFRKPDEYEARLTELAREIHGAPAVSKPPLGPNPFSGTAISATQPKALASIVEARLKDGILETDWYSSERKKAETGIGKLKLSGFMEVRFGVHSALSKSQIELSNAVSGPVCRAVEPRAPNRTAVDLATVEVGQGTNFGHGELVLCDGVHLAWPMFGRSHVSPPPLNHNTAKIARWPSGVCLASSPLALRKGFARCGCGFRMAAPTVTRGFKRLVASGSTQNEIFPKKRSSRAVVSRGLSESDMPVPCACEHQFRVADCRLIGGRPNFPVRITTPRLAVTKNAMPRQCKRVGGRGLRAGLIAVLALAFSYAADLPGFCSRVSYS